MPAMIAFAAWLAPFIVTGLLSVLGIIFKDAIMGVIVDLLGLGVNAINSVSISMPTMDQVLAQLPPIVPLVLARLGLDDCLAIIVSAWSIRAAVGMFGVINSFRKPSLGG